MINKGNIVKNDKILLQISLPNFSILKVTDDPVIAKSQ